MSVPPCLSLLFAQQLLFYLQVFIFSLITCTFNRLQKCKETCVKLEFFLHLFHKTPPNRHVLRKHSRYMHSVASRGAAATHATLSGGAPWCLFSQFDQTPTGPCTSKALCYCTEIMCGNFCEAGLSVLTQCKL